MGESFVSAEAARRLSCDAGVIDNPPVPEPAGIAEAELQEIQKQNRTVILRVYTTD